MTSGIRSSSAASAARATFSPTTAPIEPPMNAKSMTTIATGVPSIRPVPHTAASRSPVASCAAATRSGYAFWSTKPERVHRHEPGVALLPGALVEQLRQAHRRRQPEVVAARRADVHRLLELLVEQLLLARRAARPHVLGAGGLAPGAEGRELHRHQAGPPRPGRRGARRSRRGDDERRDAGRRAARPGGARGSGHGAVADGRAGRERARRAPRDVRDPDQRDRRGGDRPAHEQRPPGAGLAGGAVDGVRVGRVELAAEDRLDQRIGLEDGGRRARQLDQRAATGRGEGRASLAGGELGEPAREALLEPERRVDADERGPQDARGLDGRRGPGWRRTARRAAWRSTAASSASR